MTISQMHNMTQKRFQTDSEKEYIDDVQAFQRRKARQEAAERSSEDYFTGWNPDDEEPEPVQEDHMLKALDKMFKL